MISAVIAGEGGTSHEEHLEQLRVEEEFRKKSYLALVNGTVGSMMQFNCGGEKHVVYAETLRRMKGTMLADLANDPALRERYPKDQDGCIFFDRHPQVAAAQPAL
jgi:hypothetical protein